MENTGFIKSVFFVLRKLFKDSLFFAECFVALEIISGFERSVNVLSVRSVPFTDIKRYAVRTAPGKLLCCKAFKSAVGGNRRQRPTEAEAVRQKNV